MASKGQSITIQFFVFDSTTLAGVTGDAANLTLRWVADGTAAAPAASPAEVDSTNCPGLYKVVISGSEANCNVGTLFAKSSTSNALSAPVHVVFENLPTAAAGAAGGLLTTTTWTDAKAGYLDAAITSRAAAATALTNVTWTDARAAYLDAAITSRAAAATALSNVTWTDARAVKLDNLDAAVTTRAAAATALSTADWTGARAAKLDNLSGDAYARLGAPAGASIAADVAAVKAETNSTKTVTDRVSGMLEADGGVYRFTTNALEQAPSSSATLVPLYVALANYDGSSPQLNTFTIVKGDAYTSSPLRPISFVKVAGATWPSSLSGYTVKCYFTRNASNTTSGADTFNATCTVLSDSAVNLYLTAAQTDTLGPGTAAYKYQLIATKDLEAWTLEVGTVTVLAEQVA